MINWSLINNDSFEDLVFDYVQDKEPDYNWIKTPPSGDGNKDIFCEHNSTVLNNTYNEQYWFEAKYKSHTAINQALSKGQLDPTLVSGYLAGNVKLIVFISNGKFTDTYILRARKFFHNGLRAVDFRDREDLENWLYEKPQFQKKYFETTVKKNRTSSNVRVKHACFFYKNEYKRNIYNLTKILNNADLYILYANLNVCHDGLYSINIDSDYIKIIDNQKSIFLSKGNIDIAFTVCT